MLLRRLLLICVLFVGALHANVVLAAPVVAAPTSSSDAHSGKGPEGAETEKMAPDSPRAALIDFHHLVRAGDFAGAARYLDLSKVETAEGATLAQHLKEVLAQRLWLDPDKVSPESHGNTADNQATDHEQLGTIRAASGKLEPVTLIRKSYRAGSHWVFSADTVAQIEGWYDHLENLWLIDHLPKPLLHMGPRLLRWWQWIALGPLLMAGWAVSFVVTRAARGLSRRALSETGASQLHQLHGPLAMALTVGLTYAALPWLGLYQPAEQFLHRWASALLLAALFWALWRGVELSRSSMSSSRWARESLSAHSLLSLCTRLAKFAVAAVAFMIVLSQLGYKATSVLTGLGIGGVALALAAQKTVENLFGAFSLAVDQPFREGDSIRVDGIEGVVEAVGLRSTRIRSADRTVISIPNGKLAEMRVETLSRQDRLRFFTKLGLAHGSSGQIDQVLSAIRELLVAEPLVDAQSVGVRFVALTDSAMVLEVAAMLDTVDADKFMAAREKLLLGVLQSVERAGAKLAHQTRSVELLSPLPTPKPTADDAHNAHEPQPGSAPRLSKTG